MIKTLEGPTRMLQQQFSSLGLIFHANEFSENGHFGGFVKNRLANVYVIYVFVILLRAG